MCVCSGKTPPDDRAAAVYNNCRNDMKLTVSKQDSCAADDTCISLCTVGSRQVSLHRKSSCNISHATRHPHSRWISWISAEQPINHADVDNSRSDEVTQLKAHRALAERRHDSLDEQGRGETDAQVTDYDWTSQCDVTSELDSGRSSLMTWSRYEDNSRTTKSVLRGDDTVKIPSWLQEQADADDDEHDDDTQLKLQDTELSKLQLPARISASISVQCTS